MSEDIGAVLTAVGVLDGKVDTVQRMLSERIALCREGDKEQNLRIRKTELEIAVLKQRLTHLTGIGAVLQGGMITALTWLGLRQ